MYFIGHSYHKLKCLCDFDVVIQHILVLDLAQVCKLNEKINNHLNLPKNIKIIIPFFVKS